MRQSTSQILKFIIMGSFAALVHGLILYAGVRFLHLSPAWANVLAFLCAFITSFLGHSWVTFSDNIKNKDRKSNTQRMGKWFATSTLGFILNQGLFMLGLAIYGESYYLLIWFVVTAIVTISSFLLGKLWAFRS